jgi:osmotically-inducible protein OsmY
MESDGKQMMRKGTGTIYRIVVHSELSRQYAVAFEEMEMETKNGDTVLTGEVIDHNNSWVVNTIVCGVFIALILL